MQVIVERIERESDDLVDLGSDERISLTRYININFRVVLGDIELEGTTSINAEEFKNNAVHFEEVEEFIKDKLKKALT